MTAQSSLDAKLDKLVRRHSELSDALGNPSLPGSDVAKLSKEYSDLSAVVQSIAALRKTQADIGSVAAPLRWPSTCATESKSRASESR